MNPFLFRNQQNPLLGGQNMMSLLGGMGGQMPMQQMQMPPQMREATMNIDDGNRGHTNTDPDPRNGGNNGGGGGNKDPDPKKKPKHPYALRYQAPHWSFPQYSQQWAFDTPKVR